MRRTSLSQTVPHSEDNLGDEEDNLGDEEDNNMRKTGRQSRRWGGQVYHKQYHIQKTI